MTTQARLKYYETLKYRDELLEKRLKQIQHLLVENHQLKKELDQARELVDNWKLSTPSIIYPKKIRYDY